MFKDPWDTSQTPYDILGLDPDASSDEVHQSLPRFMRDKKNIPNLGKAQEALRRLKSPKGRMAIDILYYCMGEVNAEGAEDVDLELRLRGLCTVPHVSEDELYSDLKTQDLSDDIREIIVKKMEIRELKAYDDFESSLPELEFDR